MKKLIAVLCVLHAFASFSSAQSDPLVAGDVSYMQISITRSSIDGGWFFILGLASDISGSRLGSVNDNPNDFTDLNSYAPAPVGLWVGRDSEDIAVQAGDYLTIKIDSGDWRNIYLPEIHGGDIKLYVGADGSTYYDPSLTVLACAANLLTDIYVSFGPESAGTKTWIEGIFYPPWPRWFYFDSAQGSAKYYGLAGVLEYGWMTD